MHKHDDGHFSLRLKISLMNLFIVMAALLLFALVFVKRTYDGMSEQTLRAAQASLYQTGIFMEERVSAFRSSIDSVSLNDRDQKILDSDNSRKYQDVLSWNIDYETILTDVDNVLYRSDIGKIRIYTKNALARTGTETIRPLSSVLDTPWYAQTRNTMYSCFWCAPSDLEPRENDGQYVCFTRNLPYAYQNCATYYVGFVKKELFEKLLKANITDEYTSYYVINSKDKLLFLENVSNSEAYSDIVRWVRNRQKKSDAPIRVQPVKVGGSVYCVGAREIPQTDLTLIYTCGFTRKGADTIRENIVNMLVITLFLLPLVLIFSFFTAHLITKPIVRLKSAMLTVSEGNFNIPVLPQASDREMRALTRCFNYMLTKISMLLDAQYEDGKRMKGLELKALQAQINPHFLYNTLDLIRWKAVKDGNREIQSLVTALSTYYRKGLSKGAEFVTLRSEADQVVSYVYIQNMRFGNSIRLALDLAKDCENCLLPKLTLQPLVENAIVHGILETEDSAGSVLVKSYREGDRIVLVVADDGVGMEQSRADCLLHAPQDDPAVQSGYGLHNIDERNKLVFGESYRLDFISQPRRGTAVVLRIPFVFPNTPGPLKG